MRDMPADYEWEEWGLYYPGGDKKILMIHGFLSSPMNLDYLAKKLNEEGFTVLSVRLPGHDRRPEDLIRIYWQDWLEYVELAYKEFGPSLVVGESTGGNLALILASKERVPGVVLLSTPYRLKDRRMKYIPILKDRWWETTYDVKDDKAVAYVYDVFPVESIIQVKELIEKSSEILEEVRSPVLIIHSLLDETIPFENAFELVKRLGSDSIEIFKVRRSGHLVAIDYDKELVYRKILEFAERVLKN